MAVSEALSESADIPRDLPIAEDLEHQGICEGERISEGQPMLMPKKSVGCVRKLLILL